jgi:hypothetical protein
MRRWISLGRGPGSGTSGGGIYDRDLWDAWERSEISYKAKYVPHLTCDIVYDNAGEAADLRCGDE